MICILAQLFCSINILSFALSVGTEENNLDITENGSYMRSDGIIVLVDGDVESYINGTLKFIYPDDDSELYQTFKKSRS